MKLEHNLRDLVIFSEAALVEAINKLNANHRKVVFCVDRSGVLEGVLTDGDLRRWLIGQETIDLSHPAIDAANRSFTSVPEGTSSEAIADLLSDRIQYVPVVDGRGRMIAVADRQSMVFQVGPFLIDDTSPVLTIAEIGINHNGDVATARRMIDAAAAAGADCVKFQMRNMESLYRDSGETQDANEDLGAQYTLDLLARFQLERSEMFELFDHCKAKGVLPLCTPWDLPSIEDLETYGIEGYKVASADLTNHELLRAIAGTGKPLLISTGMSTEEEIHEAVRLLQDAGARYVLLHCNSTYPAPFKDINLNYLGHLKEIGGCHVGYSGHERGFHVALAAVALGAKVIEKHFTLDRNMEGVDHKVSLLPEEFGLMVKSIRETEEALGVSGPRTASQGELMNRVTLAKSLVAASPIAVGDLITRQMVDIKGPGRGLQPNKLDALVGRTSKRAIPPGEFFYDSDLLDESVVPRPYSFRRPWGVPVRYHDVDQILKIAEPDFVEFHLSYRDMDIDHRRFLDGTYETGYAVHSPDLFANGHILNLAAEEPAYHRRSIDELKRVVELTHDLGEHFPSTTDPVLIVSMGGFTEDRHLLPAERTPLYQRVGEALAQIDFGRARVVAQTLPPFPWYLGGQLFCNLFVEPEDTVAFCAEFDQQLCLDVSHSRLAANFHRASFSEWVEQFGPYAAHLHLVDAAGVDGEGLQIGDGDIDWAVLAEQLDRLAPGAGFIPEIWQGHQNEGEGFWVANDRLEAWF